MSDHEFKKGDFAMVEIEGVRADEWLYVRDGEYSKSIKAGL